MKQPQTNGSEFTLDRTCSKAAEEIVLDQTFFTVDASIFEKFQVLLAHPLPSTKKLRRLLKTKAPWDK